MTDGPDLHDALGRLDAALRSAGFSYAVIGGMAVVLRGYNRFTMDVDAVVLEADDRFPELLSALERHGITFRISDPVAFAKRNRVMLMRTSDGVPIDLSMGALNFELSAVERAPEEQLTPELSAPVVVIEDLMVMKLIALRDRDKDDVMRLLELYPDIDREAILATVTEFAEALESPETVAEARRLLKMPG